MTAEDAVIAIQCTDVALREQAWTNLGGADAFDPSSWPIPWFCYRDPVRQRYWILRAQRPGDMAAKDYIREVSRDEAGAYPRNEVLSREAVVGVLEARIESGESPR